MTPDADYPALSEFITTTEGLESVLGRPDPRVLDKVVNTLDDICLAFIARSPFVIVASHEAGGRVDVSPKGDPAGFAHVLDRRTITIPERPGNLRADTFRNVLQQPRVRPDLSCSGKGKRSGSAGRRALRATGGCASDWTSRAACRSWCWSLRSRRRSCTVPSAWSARRCGSRRVGGRKGSPRSERRWLFMVIWTYRSRNARPR